jgi:prepilin-type N-terminal cleavage/methylation domain-containing protein
MKNNGGFTIVELLVVIVVIGVLAAITIVTYAGIQSRAYDAQASNIVHTYENALKIYKAEHGDYPSYANDDDSLVWVCLGTTEQYPARDGFASGECETWGGPAVTTDDAFMSELTEITDRSVSGALPVVDYGGGRARGVQFYATGKTIDYYVNGTQACPRGDKAIVNGATRCIVPLE